ncbi:hypothetical protein IW262DRAFT_1340573 [Armillaria fumosa]|nr:hypothetical protein IW262DRAFT_1340573 [Armillaria fumosa]
MSVESNVWKTLGQPTFLNDPYAPPNARRRAQLWSANGLAVWPHERRSPGRLITGVHDYQFSGQGRCRTHEVPNTLFSLLSRQEESPPSQINKKTLRSIAPIRFYSWLSFPWPLALDRQIHQSVSTPVDVDALPFPKIRSLMFCLPFTEKCTSTDTDLSLRPASNSRQCHRIRTRIRIPYHSFDGCTFKPYQYGRIRCCRGAQYLCLP